MGTNSFVSTRCTRTPAPYSPIRGTVPLSAADQNIIISDASLLVMHNRQTQLWLTQNETTFMEHQSEQYDGLIQREQNLATMDTSTSTDEHHQIQYTRAHLGVKNTRIPDQRCVLKRNTLSQHLKFAIRTSTFTFTSPPNPGWHG